MAKLNPEEVVPDGSQPGAPAGTTEVGVVPATGEVTVAPGAGGGETPQPAGTEPAPAEAPPESGLPAEGGSEAPEPVVPAPADVPAESGADGVAEYPAQGLTEYCTGLSAVLQSWVSHNQSPRGARGAALAAINEVIDILGKAGNVDFAQYFMGSTEEE